MSFRFLNGSGRTDPGFARRGAWRRVNESTSEENEEHPE